MNPRIVVFRVLSLVSVTACEAEPDLVLDAFAADIAQLQKIRQEVGLPEHLLEPDAKRTGKEFNLNKYFGVFETLRLKPETKLDWVYSLSDLGGRPLIYSRNDTQKPFATSAEFLESIRKEAELDQVEIIWDEYRAGHKRLSEKFGNGPFSFSEEAAAAREKLENQFELRLAQHPRREYWNWWRDSISTDGSEQSYLELVSLFLLGDQFALRWHSSFNDLEILPNKAAIQERLGRHYWESEGKKKFIPEDIAARALKLDPTPRVRFAGKTVEVSLLTFTKWGGFQRKSLVLARNAPHVVKSEKDKTEVEWDCGIMY